MWSIDVNKNGEFYLVFDRARRYNHLVRGLWILIGPKDNEYTKKCVVSNRQQGYYCLNDDEGNTRMLVLE